ncbi:MAG: energy-coupling factor transporter transmembrane protein EcfT [Coriobacteriales bacterium]|jgi:energy-coupling factor transport system permease protein|nr:energy-coupling factor transporter transmembrane protein EcfT [Coriobacteriales bacterium]
MALVVPFGQYVPGTSPVHTLDARMKLLLVAAYVAALFLVDGWLGLLFATALLIVGYRVAHIPLRLGARGLKPIVIILAFTFLANTLTFSADLAGSIGAETATDFIPLIGSFGIRPLGALRGLYFALRIVLLVSVTSLLTFSTSIVALSDALTQLMRPLAALRVPTEDIAMMFTIALRFIPLTAEEAEKIMVAQSARGAVFDAGGPLRRARAWVPVLVPLFVSLFRRADALAGAMETRCYRGRGRTHLRVSTLSGAHLAAGLIGALVLVAGGIVL